VNCHLFKALIQEYYDGELDSIERAEYENHRRLCSGCQEFDRQFASVFEALGEIPLFEPSDDFNGRVLAPGDISRYRVGAVGRALNVLGGVFERAPAPIRVGGAIAVVFALFVAAYRPFQQILISLGEKSANFLGSGLLIIVEAARRPETILRYFRSTTNYKVAGETLLRISQKVISGIPFSHIGLVIAVILIMLFLVIRTARIAWKKGETHVCAF
jgi:hypothetical protein